MLAAVRTKYGPIENLTVQEIEKPVPKEDQILVKVFATTVNRTDCAVLTGKPFIMRFFPDYLNLNYLCLALILLASSKQSEKM